MAITGLDMGHTMDTSVRRYPGGFLYTFRQAFKIIFHNEHIELHDGERQDAGGIGIQQPQASYDHISGDHTAEKHHADDIQQ